DLPSSGRTVAQKQDSTPIRENQSAFGSRHTSKESAKNIGRSGIRSESQKRILRRYRPELESQRSAHYRRSSRRNSADLRILKCAGATTQRRVGYPREES